MADIRILVADHDVENQMTIVDTLIGEGYETVRASNGTKALQTLREEQIDLAIISVGLPGINGTNVLRTARSQGVKTPIIGVTGADTESVVLYFECGADDCVRKPISICELSCRVRALLRRSMPSEKLAAPSLRFGDLEIDEDALEVRVRGVDVKLRPKEFILFSVLAKSPGVVLSRRTLIERAWGFDYRGTERAVDGHIRRIRERLEDDYKLPLEIRSIYGFGYKFMSMAPFPNFSKALPMSSARLQGA